MTEPVRESIASESADATQPAPASVPGMAHVPALDGLRGVAVAGVVAHHLGYLRGGFLGVDLFFVLSGFLITSLLLTEWERTSAVGLTRFWMRRARRLFPALVLVLVAVAAYAAFVALPAELPRIRKDGLGTLLYVQNWREILAGTNYWEQYAAPSPLQHMWSLAIEEQFYLLWPLVVLAVLGRGAATRPRRRIVGLLALSVGLVVASALATVVLHRPGEDVSRVYYGTDTRAGAILIGAALACAIVLFGHPRSQRMRSALQGSSVVAAVVLGVAWIGARGQGRVLYEGGFLVCGLAVGTVIAATTGPDRGPLARLLSAPPLRFLGSISYGLYLWHWPVIVYLSPVRTGVTGPTLAVLRLAVALGLSVASYHLVEQPIRRGAIPNRTFLRGAPAAFAACAALVVMATVGMGDAQGGLLTSGAQSAELTDGQQSIPPRRPGGPRLLVIGDSGAASLAAGMDVVAPELGVGVVNRAIIGCVLGNDTKRQRTDDGTIVDERGTCDGLVERWRSTLLEAEPDAVLLFQASPGGYETEIDGSWVDDCSRRFHDWYLGAYVEALRALTSTGAPVGVANTPYRITSFAPPRAAETDCRNRVLEQAVRAVPGVRLVDLTGWVCGGNGDGDCPTEVDGVNLRPDGAHFGGEGGEVAARWLIPRVLALE